MIFETGLPFPLLALAAPLALVLLFVAVLAVLRQRASPRRWRKPLFRMSQLEGWEVDSDDDAARARQALTLTAKDEGWVMSMAQVQGAVQDSGLHEMLYSTCFRIPRHQLADRRDTPEGALHRRMALRTPNLLEDDLSRLRKWGDGQHRWVVLSRVLAEACGPLDGPLSRLHLVERGGHGVLFATPGDEDALSTLQSIPELGKLYRRMRVHQPTLIRDHDGVELRLHRPVQDATHLMDFIAAGRAVAQRICDDRP